MDIDATQNRIIEEFSDRTEWFDKYEYLIALGKDLDVPEDGLKTEENRISECQSETWLSVEMHGNRIRVRADSDAMITRGMISLLLRVLNNRTPRDIVDSDLYFIEGIGLKSHLSPARSTGLASIVQGIKSRARELMS